ncbi:hypothetical protein ABZ935_02615 [Streptomyces coeruleorubidus]|uniref:hypothetical protein n=1 Tax=Streptomyces coeruleorubidus TaxID=116188 RepID=UPI0033D5ABFC
MSLSTLVLVRRPSGGSDGLVLGADPLLPLPDDVRGEAEVVGVGVVVLDVLPEAFAKVVGEGLQAVVVQRGLTFTEIVHQQVTDSTAAQAIAVDQFLRGSLSQVADLAQIPRGILSESSELVQQAVEHLGPHHRPLEHHGLGLKQFQDVADGDVGDRAALRREDEGAAAKRCSDGARPHAVGLSTQLSQPLKSVRVSAVCHGADQHSLAAGPGGQPVHRRPQQLSTDHRRQGPTHHRHAPGRLQAALVKPLLDHRPPGGAGLFDAAGLPPFLPGLPGLIFQPVQHHDDAVFMAQFAAGVLQRVGRTGQQSGRLGAGALDARPVVGNTSGGEALPGSRRAREIRLQSSGRCVAADVRR